MKDSLPRNIVFGFLSVFLPLISTLIVTPFVVRAMGAEEYGLLALLLGFISYSFNFFIGRAVTKYVAEYRVTGEIEKIENVISATFFLSVIIGLLGGGILLALSVPLVRDVLLIETEFQAKAIFGFYIAAAITVFLLLQQVFSAVLHAVGRFDWFSHITTVFSTLLTLVNLVLVWLGGDTIVLLYWNLIQTILGAAAFYWASRKFLPEARFRLHFDRESFRRVAYFSGGVIAYQICSNLFFLFERTLITRNFGTEGLTYYIVPMTMATYIQVMMLNLSLALMPLSSEIAARRDLERLAEIYERASKYVCLTVVFICVSLSVGSRVLLENWLGSDFGERSWALFIWHVISFGIVGAFVIAWHMTEGLGFPGRNARLSLSWTLGGVVLMTYFAPVWGLEGIAVGRTLIVAVSFPIFLYLIERATFGKMLWQFWQRTFLMLAFAGVLSATTEYLILKQMPSGWLSLFTAVTVGGLVFLGTLLLIKFFTTEEKLWLRQFASRVFAVN